MRSAQLPRCAVGDAGESAPAPPPAAEAAGADGDAGIPESMVAIAEALQQDSIAPQWTDGAVEPAGESGGASPQVWPVGSSRTGIAFAHERAKNPTHPAVAAWLKLVCPMGQLSNLPYFRPAK